jgi:hypothetical protein
MTPDDHLNPVSTPLSHIAAPWRNTTSRSMGRRGNPYDNGQGEGFLKTIKCEEVYLGDYKTYADVIAHLPYFMDEVYNRASYYPSGYVIEKLRFCWQESCPAGV